MKEFLGEDFLLESDAAVRLYHDFAEPLPIFDYHCHLSARDIWEDKPFSGITELWLAGDHYKWRLMRAFGVDEALITGDGDDFEKFLAYAKCLQFALGNPLYHWSHLELRRYFGIRETLTEQTAKQIFEQTNEALKSPDFSPRALLKRSNVTFLGTTDDPTDDLSYHEKLQKSPFSVKVSPTFRPDKALDVESGDFVDYIHQLSESSGVTIKTYGDVKCALQKRMDYFAKMGCRSADHGLSSLPFCQKKSAEVVFSSALSGKKIDKSGAESYKTDLLLWLGGEYAKRDWVMQWHMGARRNNNTKMFKVLGKDAGFDSMEDKPIIENLSCLLDALAKSGSLPKTILYSLNPKDNDAIVTMMANFQGGSFGHLQFGSAWWLNDHKDGMEAQLRSMANGGALATFIGMLTDSRSFLSFSRHEYFRRILCNLVGGWVERGEFTNDEAILKELITGICYKNAQTYFGERSYKDETTVSD